MSQSRQGVNDSLSRFVFYLIVLLGIILLANGAYLALIDAIERLSSIVIQNSSYQYMFAFHLLLGVIALLLTVVYVYRHTRRAAGSRNSAAAKQGQRLVVTLAVIYITGILLTRGIIDVDNYVPYIRLLFYFLHVALPLFAIFIYLKHRRLGDNRKQFLNRLLVPVLVVFGAGPLLAHIPGSSKPGDVLEKQSTSLLPSLIKTSHGGPVAEHELMRTDYCRQCHDDSYERWSHSAHRYSSFNNPFYRLSIDNLRQKLKQRDGKSNASRLCAGCHDPIPLLSGEFDQQEFSVDTHVSASAGLTCSLCHSVTRINSVRGNSDFTITVPEHYPFAFSHSAVMRWFSNLLIKSNPDFHSRTFLKPLHKTAEFCSTCHKVHIPPEVNNYVWLRGQDHYDAFLLSGVSGHSVSSFYYPDMAVERCASCHMPPFRSDEFGARHAEKNLLGNDRYLHDHLFAAANTALSHELENGNADILEQRQAFLANAATVDIIGLREDGRIDGKLISPLEMPALRLQRGGTYLLEVVVRTTGMGHTFTQGTSDSNQVWLELQLANDGRVFAQNGTLDATSRRLADNSHMINSYLVDEEGNRISRRNAEDIHTVLYDHQIPPGAADVIHYRFTIPQDMMGSIEIAAALNYRKFDTDYYLLSTDNDDDVNPLPVTTIFHDQVSVKLTGAEEPVAIAKRQTKPLWQRLNDYGIGLFRKPDKSQFRQAEAVFKKVEELGRQEGTLNLARLYYSDGRLEAASSVLDRLDYTAIDNPWTATWLAALINRDNGYLDEAITLFEKLINTQWSSAVARDFDFSKDYRLLNTCASTLLTRARMEKPGTADRQAFTDRARAMYERALSLDPENVAAHYGMMQLYRLEGHTALAEKHQALHKLYKPDDSSRDRAIGLAREKDPYADLTANPVVIYDLVKVN